MDLSKYRASELEQLRTAELMELVPQKGHHALDIGARDGHFSLLLANRYDSVTALDLSLPMVRHARVRCVQGNAASLPFDSNSFDLVFCAEVLEHIPSQILTTVCQELSRVARDKILIGVPYRQDLRVGRTTCRQCGFVNPPWAHVNSFDEVRINRLFPDCRMDALKMVGINKASTNNWSSRLMDYAGNPYGTYGQEEPCMQCGQTLDRAPERTFAQKIATKMAFWSRSCTSAWTRPHANWMHALLIKQKT